MRIVGPWIDRASCGAARSQTWTPLALQLLLQFVEEAPVGALGDKLLRARLDHPGLAQAERVEAHGVLGVVLPPLAVRQFAHRLSHVLFVRRESQVEVRLHRTVRISSANVAGFEDRAQRPLGCDWMA